MSKRLLNIVACVVVGLVVVTLGVIIWQQSQHPNDYSEVIDFPAPPPPKVSATKPAAPQPPRGPNPPAPLPQVKKQPEPDEPPQPAAEPVRKGDLTWSQVEEAFERVRRARKEKPVLNHDLNSMYDDVAAPAYTDSADYPAHCAALAKWRDEFPQSPTPLIALAKSHIDYAWQARGGGYAFTVTDDGWQLFHTRIDEARRLLEKAAKLDLKDGEAYRQLLIVAMAESLPDEQVRAWFDAGRKIDPGYAALYTQMATSKMPRWGGAPGDVERFAAEVAELVPGEDGLELFGLIAREIHRYECDDPTTILWGDYDRRLLAKSADVLVARYPQAQSVVQFAALCSQVCQDHELARRIRPLVGPLNANDRVWIWKNSYEDFIEWAEAKEIPGGEESSVWAALAGCVDFSFADDSRYLWAGHQFGRRSVTLFDLQTKKIRLELPHPGGVVNHALFDSASKQIVVSAWRGPLVGWMLFDLGDSAEPLVFTTPQQVTAIALNPRQKQLAWVEAKGGLRLLDLTAEDRTPRDLKVLVHTLKFSGDGTRLAAGAAEWFIFDTASGEQLLTLPSIRKPQQGMWCDQVLDIDDSGRIWATARSLGKPPPRRALIRWSANGEQPETIIADIGEGMVKLSPDRTLLAVVRDSEVNGGPSSVDVLDVGKGQRVKQLAGHWNAIGDLRFSADSKKLATIARLSDVIKVWSLDETAAAVKE